MSKNSVPTTPSKVKNTSGNNTIDLPSDFENKYEKLKQSDAPKTKPNAACVSSLSRNPQLKTELFGRRFAKVKYAFFKNEIVSDSNKVSGKIKTKSFESSCSFFGNNFIFINLANIQYDFTIILEKCSLVLTKIF